MSKTVTKADIAKSICAQSEMKQQHAKKCWMPCSES